MALETLERRAPAPGREEGPQRGPEGLDRDAPEPEEHHYLEWGEGLLFEGGWNDFQSAPESLAGLQVGRSTEQGDHEQLKELYSSGNLTVLANDSLLHQDPVQLDFHFRLTPQASAHWHGLLCDHQLFLDIPYRALDQGNRESLTATLEYVEEKTDVDSVFVNFHKARNDRGALLRAFSYMGFEVVRPDHPALPPWDNVIFMVYPLERDCGHLSSKPS